MYMFFSGGSVVKNPPAVQNLGSIPGLGRSPGEGSGNPLWYSCSENSTDTGAWVATVQRVAKSQTRLCFAEGIWKCQSVSWFSKKTPKSPREGVPTEGNLYEPWPCHLALDPHVISWPSRDQALQWHGQLIALPSESVTGGLIASR